MAPFVRFRKKIMIIFVNLLGLRLYARPDLQHDRWFLPRSDFYGWGQNNKEERLAQAKLTKKKLEEFRKILNAKKDVLIKEAVEALGDMTEIQENYADMTDQASAEVDRNFLLRIKDRERKLILKIDSVIKKIDDGTYGICELCGDPISEQRLHARPETTQCIECKTDMEANERKAKI